MERCQKYQQARRQSSQKSCPSAGRWRRATGRLLKKSTLPCSPRARPEKQDLISRQVAGVNHRRVTAPRLPAPCRRVLTRTPQPAVHLHWPRVLILRSSRQLSLSIARPAMKPNKKRVRRATRILSFRKKKLFGFFRCFSYSQFCDMIWAQWACLWRHLFWGP